MGVTAIRLPKCFIRCTRRRSLMETASVQLGQLSGLRRKRPGHRKHRAISARSEECALARIVLRLCDWVFSYVRTRLVDFDPRRRPWSRHDRCSLIDRVAAFRVLRAGSVTATSLAMVAREVILLPRSWDCRWEYGSLLQRCRAVPRRRQNDLAASRSTSRRLRRCSSRPAVDSASGGRRRVRPAFSHPRACDSRNYCAHVSLVTANRAAPCFNGDALEKGASGIDAAGDRASSRFSQHSWRWRCSGRLPTPFF